MKEYLAKINYLLGDERKKIPYFFIFFLLLATIDLFSLGLIGPFIVLILDVNEFKMFMAPIIGNFINHLEDKSIIFWSSILLLLVFLFKTILGIFVNYTIIKFSNIQMAKIRTYMMKSYQDLPYQYFKKRNSSEFLFAMTHLTTQYTKTVLFFGLKTISDSLIATFIIAFLILRYPYTFLFLVAVSMPFILLYDFKLKKHVTDLGKKNNFIGNRMLKVLNEGIRGLKEIRILGKSNFFLNKLKQSVNETAYVSTMNTTINLAPKYILEFIFVIFLVSIVIFSLYDQNQNSNIIAILGTFSIAALRILPIINQCFANFLKLRFTKDGIDRLYKDYVFLEEEQNKKDKKKSVVNKNARPFSSIKLENIFFKYDDLARNTISNISMEIKKGESVGVFGSSGSGKTTLIDIILGLLSPSSGNLYFNGKKTNNIQKSLSNQVAYLPQELFLIDNSIKKNIALGIDEEDIDLKKLNYSIMKASLHQFIDTLPDKLNTIIGENGMRISGGQRQRIALARAFYNDRKILVLDEATSALDTETENEIVKSIKKLKGSITMIVIAHRLSTLESLDKIYKIENGSIVKSGTPRDLL